MHNTKSWVARGFERGLDMGLLPVLVVLILMAATNYLTVALALDVALR